MHKARLCSFSFQDVKGLDMKSMSTFNVRETLMYLIIR
jgi:hypothetical protein